MSIKFVYASDWNHLLEKLSFFTKNSGERWIFRGVTDIEKHDLVPKVGRPGARKNDATGDNLPYSASEEKRMLEEIDRKARPYFSHRPAGPLEIMAIAQHHGMPTRLLDWTESLLVAAYFGAKYAGTGDPQGGIYAVKVSDLTILRGTEDPFSLQQKVALFWPPHISPRIPAQRGIFTVHSAPDELAFKPSHIQVLKFPKGPKTFRIKRMLDECGINQASLFPDIDGLASHMGWRYKWGHLDPT